MAKKKYYYAVVKKENGNLLVSDGKLPIYWNKKVAQEMAKEFRDYCVTRISVDNLERSILYSKPLQAKAQQNLKWIDVTDKTPELTPHGHQILVLTVDNDDNLDCLYYNTIRKAWEDEDGEVTENITYWMFLPRTPYEAPAQQSLPEGDVWRLINSIDKGMAEYFMQHNYRLMYELWKNFKEAIKNTLTPPASTPELERAEKVNYGIIKSDFVDLVNEYGGDELVDELMKYIKNIPASSNTAHLQNNRMRDWFKERTGLEDALLSEHMEEIDKKLSQTPPKQIKKQ